MLWVPNALLWVLFLLSHLLCLIAWHDLGHAETSWVQRCSSVALAGLRPCCCVWISSPYLLSELLGLHCSQLCVSRQQIAADRRSILTMTLAPKLWFIERLNGAEIPWKCLLSFLIHLTWWSGCHVRCWGCAGIEFVSVLLPCRTGTSCGELITRSALMLNASAKFPSDKNCDAAIGPFTHAFIIFIFRWIFFGLMNYKRLWIQSTISVPYFELYYSACRLSLLLQIRPKCAAHGIFCRQKHTHLFTAVMYVLDRFTLWPWQDCRARGDFSSGGVDSATWQTESESELFPV